MEHQKILDNLGLSDFHISRPGHVVTSDLHQRWGARPEPTCGFWLRQFYISLEASRLILSDGSCELFAVFPEGHIQLLRLVRAAS